MVKIAQDIYSTGVVDWDLREFHGYSTPFGSSYNAYLIIDDKPAIIDTVKNFGWPAFFSQVKDLVDPKDICYVVSNHTEPDHAGSVQ